MKIQIAALMIAFSAVHSFGAEVKGNEDNPAVVGSGIIKYFEKEFERREPFLTPDEVGRVALSLQDAERLGRKLATLRSIIKRESSEDSGFSENLELPKGLSKGLPVTDPEERANILAEMNRTAGEKAIALQNAASILDGAVF